MSKQTVTTVIGIIVLVIIVAFVVRGQGGENAEETSDNEPQSGEETASSFGESVDYTITGIDEGAGITKNTKKALEEYGLQDQWSLKTSSSSAMLTSLQDAMENEEPIIATVWKPHSAFSLSENIRQLEDPKGIYNDSEATKQFLEENASDFATDEVKSSVNSDVLATVVYDGFAEDAPAAYEMFNEFRVPASTQSDWIYQLSVEEKDAEDIAQNYVDNNQDKMPDVSADLGKDKITLGIPPWPGARVKSHVVAKMLEEQGYNTEIKELDAGALYTSLAEKDLDVNVAGWLPTTHQSYWDEHGDKLEIAGINVVETWLGLGVPEYVDDSIQSIEDLKE